MRLSRATGRALLICLTCTLVLAGCAATVSSRSSAETSATRQAQSMAQQGHLDQAAQAYLTLAAQSSDRADHYRLLAAEAWRQNGSLDQTAPILPQIKRDRLDGDEPVRLDLLHAELALRQNDAHTALQLTTQASELTPPPLRPRLLELRARALEAGGDHWGAAGARVEMDPGLSDLDRTQNRDQIIDLLSKLGAAPLQQRAATLRQSDPMLPWVNETLSKLGVAVARPQPALGQPVGTLLPGTDANVREGYKMPERIALLLPAGGAAAAAGNAIREGFFAAYAEAGNRHAPRPEVRLYDSGGNAAGAVGAYRQAVSDGAQLVVGPLTRSEVAAVFSLPQLSVPLLALNHPDSKSLPASGASEFGLLPETEGAQSADHLLDRGIHNGYVLISSDDFAQRAATAFKAELTARGGQVVGMTQLPSSGYNYAAIIAGLHASQAGGDAGLFISMRPAQARLLMPQLQIAGITLPVVGTSHVYAGTEDAAADKDLDGLEFCDSPWLFDAQPGLPNHADVAAQLQSARGVAARLFAFGMDAWNLVPYLDWLREHPGSYLPGASGQLAAEQFGRIRRVLVWAKFQDGLAHPESGSLQMDDVPSSAPATEDGSTPSPANGTAPASQSSGH